MKNLLIAIALSLASTYAYGQNVLRIGSWNVFNRPNDSVDDADFGTVFEAIGDLSVNENRQRLSILALQETDTQSALDIRDILNDTHGISSYEVITSDADGGGDRTGFVYDTSLVSLESQFELADGLTHNTLRATFAIDDELLTIYSVHLRAGTGSANRDARAFESDLLRADADMLGEGSNVLFAGDFNAQGFEQSFDNFVAVGVAQAFDVADALGDFHDNPDFLSLHTQNPGVSLDDRFDLQLGTGELFDGVGIEYLNDSFTVVGNNGTHTINERLDTGTGASPEVLAALISVSDHLPIFSDFIVVMPEILLGDVNQDGSISFSDISPFIAILSVSGDQAEADLNEDGMVDFLDIGPFIELLSSQ